MYGVTMTPYESLKRKAIIISNIKCYIHTQYENRYTKIMNKMIQICNKETC